MIVYSNFSMIFSFMRDVYNFNSFIKYFWNFLFYNVFDKFWMIMVNKNVDFFRIIFYFIDININYIMRFKVFFRNLILM